MKHVYIFTQEDIYTGERDTLEEQQLEKNYGDKSFLVFEEHNEVENPHSDSVHAFMGTEDTNSLIVAEY